MEKNQKLFGMTLVLAVAMISILISNGVSAQQYTLLCLNPGETIRFSECNPAIDDRTCQDGTCSHCVFTGSNGAFCPANINHCNQAGLTCSLLPDGNGGETEIDSTPPEITIQNPENESVHDSRRIPVSITLDEQGEISYKDNSDSRDRWRRLCSRCFSYDRKRSFSEGLNDITFRAVDRVGNINFEDVLFTIDSRSPRITSTSPGRRDLGFGVFDVLFSEENPTNLVLKYGNSELGVQNYYVDLSSNCFSGRRSTTCSTYVDVEEYDGSILTYWFELEDITGSVAQSRPVDVEVDTTYPEIVSINSEETRGRYKFVLEINESNIDEILYQIDGDRERRFCSRLRNGQCTKSMRLRNDGPHTIVFSVIDKAGNAVAESVVID